MPKHDLSGPLNIIHVDPATLALEVRKLAQQQSRQSCHPLLVLPGQVLVAGSHDPAHQLLGLSHVFDTLDTFFDLSRLALLCHERLDDTLGMAARQGNLQRIAHGREGLGTRLPQPLRGH